MGNFRKVCIQIASHTPRWRVGIAELRMILLKLLQAIEKAIILQIADLRAAVHIVGLLILTELFDEGAYLLLDCIHGSIVRPWKQCGKLGLRHLSLLLGSVHAIFLLQRGR
ncbi:hypothetical protein SDC9_73264 [bioreactor metagenome]|uniref:Uncharacterized protein n=1 Tax=bioreactor metagenome TaxID=1076179 RepID=A0A644YEL7_9ZZZZ